MRNPLRTLFEQTKTIAIIGAKDKPGSAVDRVGKYLMEKGYTVFPVHPVRQEVWGLTTYPTILDVPEPIDIVDVFRAPEFCLAHAQECLQLSKQPQCFWMQQGIRNDKAKAILEAQGIFVVDDACIMVDHAQLHQLG